MLLLCLEKDMSTLYYDLVIDNLRKDFERQEISYTHEVHLDRKIIVGDSTVTIDISDFTTEKFLYIETSGEITATINGSAIVVNGKLFMEINGLTSLTIATDSTTDIDFEVAVYGD